MATKESLPRGRDELLQAAIQFFTVNGVHNQSLRGLAAAIGTSHRMLIYHFGSREGLLTEVASVVEQQQREVFASLIDSSDTATPHDLVVGFWSLAVERSQQVAPLLLEFSAHAIQGQPHAATLKDSLVGPWIDPLTEIMTLAGHEPARARVLARLGLAVARGLLFFDLPSTGERGEVDQALEAFLDIVGLGDDLRGRDGGA